VPECLMISILLEKNRQIRTHTDFALLGEDSDVKVDPIATRQMVPTNEMNLCILPRNVCDTDSGIEEWVHGST
jgi:hypothetical protein